MDIIILQLQVLGLLLGLQLVLYGAGCLRALIWVFVGSIFMGAVHDFGALILSLRNEGKSIADITGKYLNKRVRYLFFSIIFIALLIVIAIFGLVIAIVFKIFPSAVFPFWMQIPIAVSLGFMVYKRRSNVLKNTIILLIYAFIASSLPVTALLQPRDYINKCMAVIYCNDTSLCENSCIRIICCYNSRPARI